MNLLIYKKPDEFLTDMCGASHRSKSVPAIIDSHT